MTQSDQYKAYQQMDYLADMVGADVARDLLKASIEVSPLEPALKSVGDDKLLVESAIPGTVELGTWSAGTLPVDLQNNGVGTLPVEQQTPVKVEADDDAGNTAPLQAEELGTALGGTETALVTYLAQALTTIGNDQVRVDIASDDETRTAKSVTVPSGEVWSVEASETWVVDDIQVDGTLDVRSNGTLAVYGDVTGSGNITGSGTVETRST